MIGYSSKLIVTHSFQIINNNLFSILLGKFYNEKEVGYFNQANKWSTMGYTTINGMLTSVAQPVLSTLSDDKERQLNALRKMLRFTAFVSFPAMFGLSFTSQELIVLAVTDKWLPSANIMQILCIGGAFIPFSGLFSQLMLSRGHSSIYMWNTIALSLSQLFGAYLLYPYGITPMLYAFISINMGWTFVWLHFIQKEIKLSLPNFLKDISPYLLLSIACIFACSFITEPIENVGLRLIGKISIVGLFYIAILWKANSTILQESIHFIFKKKGV